MSVRCLTVTSRSRTHRELGTSTLLPATIVAVVAAHNRPSCIYRLRKNLMGHIEHGTAAVVSSAQAVPCPGFQRSCPSAAAVHHHAPFFRPQPMPIQPVPVYP